MSSALLPGLMQAAALMLLLALMGAWLELRGILPRESLPILTRLVTDFLFPLFLFGSLARAEFSFHQLTLPLILALAELACLAAAWFAARLLGLNRAQTGAFLLCAAFGSVSFLGVAVIQQIFPGDAQAMANASMTLEFGMSILMITLGVAMAMHYGGRGDGDVGAYLRKFFTGPIFIGMVAGVAWSLLELPHDGALASFIFRFCDMLGQALPVVALLCIGLMLRKIPWRNFIPVLLTAAAIKLLLQPSLAGLAAPAFDLGMLELEELLILAAMPTAVFAAILSERYGCDGKLATSLMIATLLLSPLTMPLIVTLWLTGAASA